MTLLELRTQLRKETGRADLVNSDYTDNGMDVKINDAIKYLDETVVHKRSFAQYKYDIYSGEYKVNVPYIRSIRKVWAFNTSDGVIKLNPLTFEEFKEKYSDGISNSDPAAPADYCSSILNLQYGQHADYANLAAFLAAVAGGTAEFTMDYDELMFGDNQEYSGLLIGPQADGTYTISVWGEFYSMPLEAEGDECFWSVVHPRLLRLAVMRELEVDHRNSEGVRDWERAMDKYTFNLEADMVMEQISKTNQMGG